MGVETRETKLYGKVFDIRYHDAEGKYVREVCGPAAAGWTRAKAAAVLRQRRVEAHNGFRSPTPVSFIQVARDWLDEEEIRRSWAPRTVAAHTRSVDLLVDFHNTKLGQLRAREIDDWAVSKLSVYSPKTISMALSVMRQVLDHAIRKGHLTNNPARIVRNPKLPKKNWRILTPAEIQKIAPNFPDDQHRLMFRVLAQTALRRHELLGLLWTDIDFQKMVLRVRKSKTEQGERSIALPGRLWRDLYEWRRECGFHDESYVFKAPAPRYKTSSKDGRISLEEAYKKSFRVALQKSGITDYVRPFHDMRHTSLTNSAVLQGTTDIMLATKAGHTDPKITRQYLHLAGTVFHDEANQLERRLVGEGNNPEE